MPNVFSLKKDIPLPRGLKVMAFGELLDRFTFYGTITLLTLYLTRVFHYSDYQLYEFWGFLAALGFGLPVVGGILADRLLGFRMAINVGACFIVIGALILLLPDKNALLLGLSFMVCGIGFYKGNVTGLIGLLYQDQDKHREHGFLIFYIFMVTGAILGPLVYGVCSELFGFRSAFFLSALGFLSFLVLFNQRYVTFAFKQSVKQLEKSRFFHWNILKKIAFSAILLACVFLLAATMNIPKISNTVFLIFSVVVFFALLIYVCFKEKAYTGNILVIGIVSIINAIYFAAGIQVNGSLVLFLSHSAQYSIFGFHISPIVFSSLEPLFSVLFASTFMHFWAKLKISDINLNMIILLIVGLFLTALAFELFSWSASYSTQYRWSILLGIIAGNLALALSGVCILPTLMSSVTRLAPKPFLGTMVGMKFMINAAAGSLGGYIAILSGGHVLAHNNSINRHLGYAALFHQIALVVFWISVCTLVFIPLIKKILKLGKKQKGRRW